jgi:methyl-accepting chemotaxis protein WspA
LDGGDGPSGGLLIILEASNVKIGTVRKKIVLGFSAVILLMVGLCVFAYMQLRGIEAQATALRVESVPGLYLAGRLHTVSVSTYTSVQQLILERDPARMQQIKAYLEDRTAERLDLLKKYEPTIRTEKQRELHEATKTALAPYMTVRRQVERLSADPKTKADAATLLHDQLDPLYRKLQDAIEAELAFSKAAADEANRQIEETVARAQTGMLVSLLIGVVLAAVAGSLLVQAINRPLARLVASMELLRGGDFSQKITLAQDGEFSILADGLNLVTDSLQAMAKKAEQVAGGNLAIEVKRLSPRDVMGNALAEMIEKLSSLIRRVQKSGLQVNTSATEIAATAQEQLSTASQVAATTSEIGATSKEISTTSRELVQTIKEIAEVAEKTAVLAGSGQTGLNRMKATMQQVMEASASINSRLGALSEKAGNIGTVVTTITRVADQTNLLSLNAAIEAEKAGDYGRGFAVVAAEIRRLADQTALATGDIEQMVKEMQSAVVAGVMGMDKFSEEVRRGGEVVQQVSDELSQIIHHVQALTPNFETVSEGMQSQSQGAQQISDALSQLSEASAQTVESLRQSNSAIEQLNEAARGLQDGVARFTLQA